MISAALFALAAACVLAALYLGNKLPLDRRPECGERDPERDDWDFFADIYTTRGDWRRRLVFLLTLAGLFACVLGIALMRRGRSL